MAARKNSGRKKSSPDQSLRKHLVELLKGGNAHISFADGLKDLPADKRGAFAPGLPHTGWQLLEHARIAQWDILEFSRNPKHVSPEFPEGYWPQTPLPGDAAAWDKSVKAFQRDLSHLHELFDDTVAGQWPFADMLHDITATSKRDALLAALKAGHAVEI